MNSPIRSGDAYFKTESGLMHYEGIIQTRAEIASFRTDFLPGSTLICQEDWSVWMLVFGTDALTWDEVDI